MAQQLSQTEFYFPQNEETLSDKRQLVDLIVAEMKKRGSMEYSGHRNEKDLREGLVKYLGDAPVSGYEPLTRSQEDEISELIERTVVSCNETLEIPTKNFIFVFPYLPGEEEKAFEGVMGVARYSCVLHLFVDPKQWSEKVLQNTLAHELNHTIYYYRHYDSFGKYTLLDEMLMEGLAECFREEVIDPAPSPWASALTRQEAAEALSSMGEEMLASKERDVIKEVLFGNSSYARWTGYSVGYWLVKNFIEQKKDLSWEEIMKTDSQRILESFNKKGA